MPPPPLIRRGLDLAKSMWAIISSRRPVRIAVGIILLFVGIAGLFLPVLQGVATIVAALAILRKDIPMAERIWQRWIIPQQQRSQQWLQAYRERRAQRRQAQALKRASMEKPWYFIQLSDTHIVADTRQESHGVNTYATLSRAIAQVNHLDPPPAFAIFTGDLINDDDPQSYRVLKQLTDQLRVPTYFALGNHDLRQPFRQVFLGEQEPGTTPYYYTFDRVQYRFIVLDSLVEGEVGGALDATQLAWLETTLATAPTRPTIVFVHHPPAPTGIDWMDAHAIANGTEFLAVLARHSQVRRVFFGHVHTALHITAHGVQCTSVPSTCYQFGDLIVTPKVFAGPPGYGVVVLRDEQVSSRVTYF